MSDKTAPTFKNRNLALTAAMAAVAMSAGLVAAKSWVWMLGGSAAILASLVDSLIDALISFTNYLAIRYAHRPPDDDHRYGHGKAEGIAALVQAAFIAGSCVFVVLESIRVLRAPDAVGAIDLGIWVLAAATLVTLALTRFQEYAARHSNSLAVEADSAHYTGDVAVNIGVVVSLFAGRFLGWMWLDPVVGLMVACWLLFSARKVGLKAMNMLLDRELEDDVRTRIFTIIRETPGVEGLHDLRTRRSGPREMISFDIEADPALSMRAAHAITHEVEARLLREFPNAEVMIHVDPKGQTADSRHTQLRDFHAR